MPSWGQNFPLAGGVKAHEKLEKCREEAKLATLPDDPLLHLSQADLNERLDAIGATIGEDGKSPRVCVQQLADKLMEHLEAVRGASSGRLQAEVPSML